MSSAPWRFVPLPRFLLRAPLLPLPPFDAAAGRRLLADPLGRLAIALASPSLAARPEGAGAARALGRYGRRARFRATPHGLLAGVAVGELGDRSRVATGRPRAHVALGWGRMAALGRALLDDPAVRPQVRLRRAPSLLCGPDRARWLAFGAPFGEEREAEIDVRLARILDASQRWIAWPALRAVAASANDDGGAEIGDGDADADGDADELLLLLIDDGLLHHDLAPPLVGAPAAAWMADRLESLRPSLPAAETLARARRALAEGDLAAAREALRSLPRTRRADSDLPPDAADSDDGDGLDAVLVHQPAARVTLDRRVVQRAADLAPLLFRLQEALAPPAAERFAAGGTRAALLAAGAIYGDGALDLRGLALGEYGVDPADEQHEDDEGHPDGDAGRRGGAPPAALLRLLVDAIAGARGDGRDAIALSPQELDAILPAGAPPPSFELLLTPCRPRRGAGRRNGRGHDNDGWLLGLHAPAGATWGRFATAVGAPLGEALRDLSAAEGAAYPGQRRLDVAYAPSEALADLCAHPPIRGGVLALSGWPAPDPGGASEDDDAVTPADLELVVDGGAPIALRPRGSGGTVVPSPLGRVRSDTAPAGAYRLLAGWSLYRQHAPWALSLGPLADLAHVPRITVGGFVVSPASWRIPRDLPPGAAGRRALRRWRREARVPRFVQVGAEDQLLPVDLDDPAAVDDVTGQPRAWEIWPPATRAQTIDRDGRRLEAVVAVVATPAEPDDTAPGATAGAVPPPRLRPAAPGWMTFKIFGAEDRQDDVLLHAIAPAVRASLAARASEIDRWFFIRYVDGPGRRPHLRLRVHAPRPAGLDAFRVRLDDALGAARAAAAVATVETAEYHPEIARFGASSAAMAAAEAIFQSDSQLVCDLLAAAGAGTTDPIAAPDEVDLAVMSFDALAAGAGLDGAGRHRLARALREASSAALPPRDAAGHNPADAELRRRARRLRQALGTPPPGAITDALRAHRRRVASAAAARAPAALPSLLHLAAVRVAGARPDVEARAYLFWERTLEGLLRSPPPGGGETELDRARDHEQP